MPPTIPQPPKPTPAAQTPVVAQVSVDPNKVSSQTLEPKINQNQDLIKRASSAVSAQPAIVSQAAQGTPQEPPRISLSIEDVKDPVARQILEKKLEEANKGISEAFGKVGSEKSRYIQEIERFKSELDRARQEANQPWTPERLQRELNKQDFVQSATTLQSMAAPQGIPQETWSSWTPEEKQAFNFQQQKTQMLEQQLAAIQQSQVLSQVESELKAEYSDYDSGQVREFYQKAQSNQLSPKEMLKAIYFATNAEKLINRAYELGAQDGKANLQEKLNGLSPNGLNITPTTNLGVEKKPGERSSNVFSAHAHRVLEMLRTMPKRG